MSRRFNLGPKSRGPKLPFVIQQKLGLPTQKPRSRTQVGESRPKRQHARDTESTANKRRKLTHTVETDRGSEAEEGDSESNELILNNRPILEHHMNSDVESSDEDNVTSTRQINPRKSNRKPRSISPTSTVDSVTDEDGSSLSRGSREYSPEVVLDASSRSFREKQAEEDADILALERKLGVKGRQTEDVSRDAFEELLGNSERVDPRKKDREEERRWLQRKRQKQQIDEGPRVADSTSEEYGSADDQRDDDFEAFSNDDSQGDELNMLSVPSDNLPSLQKSTRENPYVAPVDNTASPAKYIPPSRRQPSEAESQSRQRLQRKVQGSLNRLSEANIISIVDEFDKLYQSNPRQDVTTALVDLLLAAFTVRSSLQNTFIILHAAFISALYKLFGVDFGAEVVQRLVDVFNTYHTLATSSGKETLNLIGLLANLFTFGTISSALVFDHIRLLLNDFGESSAELLLRVIRDCGPQLRSDDPTALKGIVQTMNEASARMTSQGQTITIRTRVMMDTITDLKNNKIRQATSAAGATGEHLTRMRKALGSLSTRQLRGTEPLGITRGDILNSNKKGKWWLVGASWKGTDQSAYVSAPPIRENVNTDVDLDIRDDGQDVDYTVLTQHYDMNTTVRRSIFVAVMSSEDAKDALARLSKLRLTRKQEPEIARIIIKACRAEPSYNPFYAVLSKLLLREKKFKMMFQIALWKFFETLGEKPDVSVDDDDDDTEVNDGENVESWEIANVARLYAHLTVKRSLDLGILKTLNIGFTKGNATLFLEMFFVTLFTQSKVTDEDTIASFSQVEPRMTKSLAYFLQKHVRKSDLVSDRKDQKRVKHGCQMAQAALAAVDGMDFDDDDDVNQE